MKETDFLYHYPDNDSLEPFGFKIHLSATLDNHNDIFDLVYPFLMAEKVCFKYLSSQDVIEFNFSDMESPAESGKYVTIYPKNREHCLQLLEQLYDLIPIEMEGIYILSDRAYKDSQVIFYRYGCIELDEALLEEGVPTQYGPNGERWQDYQKTYFDLPSWVEDLQEPLQLQESYLSQQYQVESLLKQGNGGNVYLARTKQTNQLVVIKESKPHIICIDEVKRATLRANEWQLSQESLRFVPQPIETVNEWINQYYIYEYVQGVSLRDYCDERNLFSYHSEKQQDNYQKYQELLTCFENILKTVASLHKQGLVLNDIHSDNFILDNDGNVVFIDLENSYKYGTEPIVGLYNDVSLREWNRLDGYLADCHKLGKLFLYLIGRLHNKTADLTSLLLQKGISSQLSDVINALFHPSARIASSIEQLKQLKSSLILRPLYQLSLASTFTEEESLDLNQLVLLNHSTIPERYDHLLTDDDRLLDQLQRERKLGLDGMSGIILYLYHKGVSKSVIDWAIQYLLAHLTVVDGLKGVKIGKNAVSPYLGNGTAGIILTLLETGNTNVAEELAPVLLFEFAQFTGIWDGMLGIAYTLLKLFAHTQKDLFLTYARELLISSLAINQDCIKHRQECLYLLAYYNSCAVKSPRKIC